MGNPSSEPSGRQRVTEKVLKNVSTMLTKVRQLLRPSDGDTVQAESLRNLSHENGPTRLRLFYYKAQVSQDTELTYVKL